LAAITNKILAEFAEWIAMPAAARASRPMICFRGMDNRTVDA
jgi:hypothetical protein